MNISTKTILRSDELNCPTCVNNIESNLRNMKGVEEVTVHFTTGRIEVTHDADVVSGQDLIKGVRQSGYESYLSDF